MKDRSLLVFTLLAQMAVGAFWVLGALFLWARWQSGPAAASALTLRGWLVVPLLASLGLLASFFHLSRPLRAWLALGNLPTSWLSREACFAVLFTGASGLLAGLRWYEVRPPAVQVVIGGAAALFGVGLVYSMAQAYRLRTVPAWDGWVTPASFFTTAFLLGGLGVGVVLVFDRGVPGELLDPALRAIALATIVLLGLCLGITLLWLAQLATGPEAAQRSMGKILRENRLLFGLRLTLVVIGLAVSGFILAPRAGAGTVGWAFGLVLVAEVLGRLLFYQARVRQGV
jgi:anaerobic dimethyl sulfoxide reductase subunit C (anchor subunit)